MTRQQVTTDKILIVDDEQRNVNILLELLEDYQTATAANGDRALELVEDFQPDIVLLDIMMPGIDGFEVCKQIRSNSLCPFTKIILVSGRTQLSDRITGYRAGADDYVVKPFDQDELLAKIKVFTRLKSIEEVEMLRTNFLNLLAHEAKTPLNSMLGFADLILSDESMETSRVREYVGLIQQQGRAFHDLVEQLLLLCELRVGRILDLEEMSIPDLVETCVRRAAGKGIDFSDVDVSIIESQSFLQGDRDLLEKALGNIIGDLAVMDTSDTALILKGEGDSETYRLSVTLPIYLSNDCRHRMMEGFCIKNVAQHSGISHLGICVAKEIAQLHGGNLGFEIRRNVGTTVWIELHL